MCKTEGEAEEAGKREDSWQGLYIAEGGANSIILLMRRPRDEALGTLRLSCCNAADALGLGARVLNQEGRQQCVRRSAEDPFSLVETQPACPSQMDCVIYTSV